MLHGRVAGSLFRDKSGNVAISTALVLIGMIGCAGVTVDYSRIYSAKSAMASALDSAIIATAVELNNRDMTDEEAGTYLTDFVNANLELADAGYDVNVDSINVDWAKLEISASVNVDLPMTLMQISGWKTVPVSVKGSAAFGSDITEVAMTFDVTGSMSGRKLADLKAAAKSGIEELLTVNTDRRERLRISVVPYADAINVGTIFSGQTWDKKSKLPDGCRTERSGKFMYTDDGPGKGPPFRDSRLADCPDAILQPLTSDKNKLDGLVNKLVASGYTAGHIGIQWAWFTLSPNWAPYLPVESAPGDYDAKLKKFAIIMTDGMFNTAFAGVPQNQNVNRQNRKSKEYALKLCDNMKAKGISVFTIGFALRNRDAIDTMQRCASPSTANYQYYFAAAGGADLAKAYRQIARQIKTVRISN